MAICTPLHGCQCAALRSSKLHAASQLHSMLQRRCGSGAPNSHCLRSSTHNRHHEYSYCIAALLTSMPSRQKACLTFGSAVVRTSASMCSVLTYVISTSLRAMRSRAKWYMTSMCLERMEVIGFFSSLMAPWLSALMTMAPLVTCRSPNSVHSHSASRIAAAAAMYSASVVETATVCCRRLDLLIAPPCQMNT